MAETIYNWSWTINGALSNLLFFIIYFKTLSKTRNSLNYFLSIFISVLFALIDSATFNNYTDLNSILIIPSSLLLIRSKNSSSDKLIVLNYSLLTVTFTQGISSVLILKTIPSLSNPQTSVQSIFLFTLLSILNYSFALLTTKIISLLNKKYHLEFFLKDSLTKKMFLIVIITANIFFMALDTLTKTLNIQKSYLMLSMIILTITIIFITVAMIMMVQSHIREIETNLKIKHMAERDAYINELERNNDELHKFKHDYKNLLLSLSASINDSDDKVLKSSVGRLINYDKVNLNSDDNKTNLYKLGDKLIKGILVSKIMQAKNQKINTHVEIDDNFNIPPQYSVMITRILGILLDNAIEASLKASTPELDVALISFDKYVEIIIKNNVISNDSIDLNEIYKSGYTTKKKHSGLGLSTVRDIVNSNSDFLIQTKIKDGYYSTILTILKK